MCLGDADLGALDLFERLGRLDNLGSFNLWIEFRKTIKTVEDWLFFISWCGFVLMLQCFYFLEQTVKR